MNNIDKALDGFRSYCVRDTVKGKLPLITEGIYIRGFHVGIHVVIAYRNKGELEPAMDGLNKVPLELYQVAETGVPSRNS
jgi:hypothetical protein